MKRSTRWLSALLALCLCLSMVPVRAAAKIPAETPASVTSRNELFTAEQPAIAQAVELDESEEDRIRLLNNGASDYRKWSQGDTRWGSLRLGSSSRTVASHGCLVTAVTKLIIQAGFRSSGSFNVGTFVQWMNANNGFYSNTANMYWGKPSECISGFTNKGRLLDSGSYSSSAYNAQLIEYLKQGYHLILAVKNKGHWIAVDEAKSLSTGTIYIMDSLSSGANADVTLASRYSTFNVAHGYMGGTTPDNANACTCSTSYAGDYICTTATSNLLIRSGHGTGYSSIGSIPSGATVYVSKASGTGAGHWAHVEYNGISGYASMEYLARKDTGVERNPRILWWMSDSEYGDAVTEFKVGNRYYFCYRIYDGVSGKDWDEIADYDYTVKITIYKPDGSELFTNTSSSDTSWISNFYKEPGEYTREVILEGDFSFSGTRTFTVEENPKQIHASASEIPLTLGETESDVVCIWTSGYHEQDCVLTWSRSNSNVSCAWGEWTDGLLPLTITANSAGSTTITLSVKEKDTQTVLDTCTVQVTVDAKNYTVSYNANGGSGVPSSQTKAHGTALTLSSTVPTRFGYTFLGWATSASATSAAYLPGGSFTTDANTTLYAVWQSAAAISSGVTSSSYSAAISFANGSKYYSFTPSFSGKIQLESTGTGDTRVYVYDTGGNQLGYNDDGGSGNNFLLTQSVTSGTTYYIMVRYFGSSTGTINFTVKRAYDITYNANGGSGAPSAQVKAHGTDLTLSSTVPTRSGYTFAGWAASSTATSAAYQPGSSFTANADTTLYAVWLASTYTVSYNANGGSGAPASQSKTHDTALTLSSAVPTRFAYNFKGWATSASAATAAYQPGDEFTANASTTLYAVWEPAQPFPQETGWYEVVYPGVGVYFKLQPTRTTMYVLSSYASGKNNLGMVRLLNAKAILYDAAGTELARQTFNGTLPIDCTYYELTANNTYYVYFCATSNLPDTAIHYTAIAGSKITYHANGGSGAPDLQYCYDSEVTLHSEVPVRSGYTFLGWDESPTATQAQYQPGDTFWTGYDTTLYAVWTSGSLASGTCGSDLTWTLNGSGVLTISGSGAMKNYTYKSEMPWYSHRSQIKSVVLENGVTSIGAYAFYGMPVLETITIPQTVTAIGAYAFKNVAALDNVILPDKLTKLGESAFYGCTALTAIDIPASLYTILPYTFKNCTALAEVTFHEGSLMKISDGAFYNTALTELVLPDCLDILDIYAFKNCAKLRSIRLGSSLTEIREAVFYGSAIDEITIPEGITKIGPYAFKNCTRLVRIDLPSTLTSVGEASFYACTALERLDLPDAVTKIGNYAFRKCAALIDVSFSKNLVNIGESAFYGCENLIFLDIPAKVTTIQGYAFKGCVNLDVVNLPESLTTLGDSAFHTCTGLGEVTIPAKVTKIGESCFSGSTGIDDLYFLGSAPAIGTGAFNKITATAYYPSGNATWTASVRQNYGGTISWVAQ